MYIGNQPVLQTSEFREEFTATAGQTVFNTLGFAYSSDSAFVEIFRNGVLLGTEDYTLGTDGTTVTLSDACSLNDIVLVKGRRAITQGISITESRTEYTWQSGDTYVQLNADIVPGYADVYLNGVKLPSAEFSIDTGTKRVTFTTTPSIGDEVSVVYRTETSSLIALPLKDSAGNNVLSETAGEVSLSLSGDLDVTGELTLGTALAVAEGGTGVTSLGSLDAADLGSGAATDGYVLTADGAGGAAWEAASGVSLPIDLLSSGASIRKSDGTTAVLSESGGAVTLENTSLGDTVLMPDNSNNVSTAPGIRFEADTDTGIGLASAGNLSIVTSGVERMRIGSGGDVFMGTFAMFKKTGPDIVNFFQNRDGQPPFWYFNTSGGYGVYSDVRLKENIIPTKQSDSVDFIKNLQVVEFNWKSGSGDSTRRISGLIAQNVLEASKTEGQKNILTNWETYDENDPDCPKMGLSDHRLIPSVIQALQVSLTLIETQAAKIDALETRIQALEAPIGE